MQSQELIAVRIKDGIFAGNVTAAEDREFLGMNKITHVVNCAGGEVADYFVGDPELRYFSFPWKDTTGSVCTTVLFDTNGDNVKRAAAFIDEALDAGDCVLVHSFYGVSRAPVLIATYLMIKYGWKLESALSFIEMAHPDVSIKPHFLRQLRLFAKKHDVEYDIFDGKVDDSSLGLDSDQWMLRNTLLNGLAFEEQQANTLYHQCTDRMETGVAKASTTRKPKMRITFVDTGKGTGTDSLSSAPVVDVRPVRHVDPTSDTPSFVGAQGTVALSSGRKSPSIMSRSISPCNRRLVSDEKENPKGRQPLHLVKGAEFSQQREEAAPTPRSSVPTPRVSSKLTAPAAVNESQLQEHQHAPAAATAAAATPTPAAPATAGTTSPPRPSVDYKRLAPPTAANPPLRSPYAALRSSNKYRNGSPLPLNQNSKKKKKLTRTNSVQSDSSKKANTVKRTPSESSRISSNAATPRRDATTPQRSSSAYKGIAPQRIPSRPAWGSGAGSKSSALEGAPVPSTVRRSGSNKPKLPRSSSNSSVGNRSASNGPRSSSVGKKRKSSVDGRVAKAKNTEAAETGSATAADSSSATTSGGVIRRQVPAAISSHRK